jgi:pimeloyl-ACP methyl ester carboxylesterase
MVRDFDRRRFLGGALALSTLSLFNGCGDTIDAIANSCPSGSNTSGGVDWPVDLTHPVFYGMQDLTSAAGPPHDTIIWYPTIDGAPSGAAILERCLTKWPVVLFLHGQPPADVSIAGYHRSWQLLPAQLARCGYVVVVPNYDADVPTDDLVNDALASLTWVRTQWEHAKWVDSRMESTAVAGHSFGALLAARIAKAHPELAAMLSLSGGFRHLSSALDAAQVNPPSMFMWAVDGNDFILLAEEDLDTQGSEVWDHLTQWRYAAKFRGDHFDYLPASATGTSARGPCPQIGALTAALGTIFIAENLPTPLSTTRVTADLKIPAATLNQTQRFYAGGNLAGIESFSDPGCSLDLRWDYNVQHGSRHLGPVV